MEKMNPRISVEYNVNATVVSFVDEKILEEKDIRDLERSLLSVINENEVAGVNLVLDFTNVKFISTLF